MEKSKRIFINLNILNKKFKNNFDEESIYKEANSRLGVSIKDSHIENECFWNYPMVIKGAFFHEAVSHLFNRVKTQNR